MEIVTFKLPKTLYHGDHFTKELKLDNPGVWYGFNKRIYVQGDKENSKINRYSIFQFQINKEPILTLQLGDMPVNDRFTTGVTSYFDITHREKKPLKVYKKNKYFFPLAYTFMIRNILDLKRLR